MTFQIGSGGAGTSAIELIGSGTSIDQSFNVNWGRYGVVFYLMSASGNNYTISSTNWTTTTFPANSSIMGCLMQDPATGNTFGQHTYDAHQATVGAEALPLRFLCSAGTALVVVWGLVKS